MTEMQQRQQKRYVMTNHSILIYLWEADDWSLLWRTATHHQGCCQTTQTAWLSQKSWTSRPSKSTQRPGGCQVSAGKKQYFSIRRLVGVGTPEAVSLTVLTSSFLLPHTAAHGNQCCQIGQIGRRIWPNLATLKVTPGGASSSPAAEQELFMHGCYSVLPRTGQPGLLHLHRFWKADSLWRTRDALGRWQWWLSL